MRNCKRCGKEIEGRADKKYCGRKCLTADAVTRWRRNLKKRAVEYKGGKCEYCGYAKCLAALEFHHPGGKDFAISGNGNTRAWAKVKVELDKCVLTCKNCHAEQHHD